MGLPTGDDKLFALQLHFADDQVVFVEDEDIIYAIIWLDNWTTLTTIGGISNKYGKN